MLSNPPYGKSWKSDLERMGGKKGMKDRRFVIEHDGDNEFSLVTRSSDGQLLFLVNLLSKMKHGTPLGSRIAEVHNGSSLFTGDAGQGESNIRRWVIENDWLEAIVALPLNMFYNTGIATYIWVLTNRKPEARKGQVQLIDATQWSKPLRKNLGKKNCELTPEHIQRICDTYIAFEETEHSKILPNRHFGYWKVVVERPLRLHSQLTIKAIEALRFASGDEQLRNELYERLGEPLFKNFGSVRSQLEKLINKWRAGEEEDEDEDGTTTKKGLPEKIKNKLLDTKTWERDGNLMESASALRREIGDKLFEDHNLFRERVDAALDKLTIRLNPADRKLLLRAVSWRVEIAPPVIAKVHKFGKKEIDPLHGLYETVVDGKKCVVEYETDTDLRDSEQVPLIEKGGIEAFFRREVLPYVPDAWIDKSGTKIGYEISFTRHFYKPQPLRTLDEVRAEIVVLEKETGGLLREIVRGGAK
jgi:type I restriction enzyme M protein